MKNKLIALREYYKLHPKRFWVGGVVLLLIIMKLVSGGSKETVTLIPVTQGDLKQTVLSTGQVTSQTDLELSFSLSDTVSALPAKVGSKVYKGQTLVVLDNRDEYASLVSAKAGYQKVLEGASNEEVAVAEAALKSAESSLENVRNTQATLVANARRAYLNTDLTPAAPASGSAGTAPTVTGTYVGEAEGDYIVTPRGTGTGGYFTYTGVENGTGSISTTAPSALGTKGLFIQFPTSFSTSSDVVWTVSLPNVKSSEYLVDYNGYQSALRTRDSAIAAAEASVNEAKASLALKKATARQADKDEAYSKVLVAQAAYDNTILRAPADGTIVSVDTKLGERVEPQKTVVILQDVTNLYVESNINETSISKVMIGQDVRMTLDAFGPDVAFTGKVIHIDPSSTTTDGVVNYKIKVSIEAPACSGADCKPLKDMVRPGMNANMDILAWMRPNVIAIPKAAITTVDGKSMVNVITNEKKKKYTLRDITIAAEGDGNMVEVTAGLVAGDIVALIQK